MAVYAVASGRIENRDQLNEYLAKAGPTIPANAKVLVADETPQVIEGDVQYPRTVIIEFPDEAAFRAWYDSAEYQAVVGLRLESAPGTLVLAQGL